MSNTLLYTVITTIQEPTRCVKSLAGVLKTLNLPLLVIGDKKGPARFDCEGCRLWSLEAQMQLPFSLAGLLPTGSYARKNLGYLIAASEGAQCLYETDDDNRPLASWHVRQKSVQAASVGQSGWYNVFRYFKDDLIWPRGFALGEIRQCIPRDQYHETPQSFLAPLQQGLVNGSPDVDAIWRLTMEHEFSFEDRPSLYLPPGVWCPFNSQSTWWWPETYPLMYLPSYCSFRMTDIWRGFIALRCLWAMGHGMVFHAPEVYQERNVHNLMRDFEDETQGYLKNRKICESLEKLDLASGPQSVGANLLRCYEMLVSTGVFPEQELKLVNAWREDLTKSFKKP